MTIFSTVIAGVFVFVLGQIVLKSIIEPIQKLREVIAEVVFYLANDHSIIHGASVIEKEEVLSAGRNLKRLGAKLVSSQQLIPFYEKIQSVCGLPKPDDIALASKRLSLISNSMFGDAADKFDRLDLYRIEVCEALGASDPINNGMTKEELKNNIKELRQQQKHNKQLNTDSGADAPPPVS